MYYLERTKRILKFVSKYAEKNKYTPTIREVAKNQNITYQGVFHYVKKMREDGYLIINNNKIRQFELSEKGKNLIK